MKKLLIGITLMLITIPSIAQKNKDKNSDAEEKKELINSGLVSGLSWRNIGPALTAGRIADMAVNPNNPNEYYLAVASGGVWKTTNHGTTFDPIFDGQDSYSIGCVTIDPNQTATVWVGTGENNNQRSVAYGDGVYKSLDGGNSWKNMGLKTSEHISKIIVDPRNSNVVYVAAYGPLWSAGGERGVYKTIDGGENWELIHSVSENTGAADLVMDPSNPDILYAAFHQRRRHVFTYIGGGEESAVFKSEDAGKTWIELTSGLPTGKMGRVGLAVSPADPNYVYAIVEAQKGSQGFYRSTNKGASWEKRGSYKTSGNYYQEIYCDPINKDKIFSLNTWLHHSIDGGKTFVATGETSKHVDNHCMWVNPENTDHWIVGCDGGLYETWDHAKTWQYKQNLPITQFYKVSVDNDAPFYNVYGGTQDNNSLGGPSRTINNAGIQNSDWYITNGGDGFESQIDPSDPNIVYAQAQYGWLVRYDRKSGEKIGIQPMPGKGEKAYRWNWDAPLVLSNHDNKTLYFAANKVFKSTDRGNSWKTISPDLTRQLDRNEMKVMGEVQSPDAVMKNKSTTIFGNIVAMDESPKNKDLIYVGTDDGLIQVTTDGGGTWNKKDNFPGVPNMTYVNMLIPSQHDEGTVYAAFNNHKKGDFKPYLLKSTDKGNTWTSIAGNLPERGSVYAIAEDHVNANLLFAGTEFGIFFTVDGGTTWVELSTGLPTIAVRDIAIQRRENDLVLGTFGRGFYVLDNYAPLRDLNKETIDKVAHIFPIRTALEYVESNPLGLRGTGSQGASHFATPNPEFGATFTYYLKDAPNSLGNQRRTKEKKDKEAGGDIDYPTYDEFVAEDTYEAAYLLFVVKDDKGNEVQKLKTAASEGINRITWNLRYPSTNPIQTSSGSVGRYSNPDVGPLALPGSYAVEMYLSDNGVLSKVSNSQSFEVKALENSSLARQSEDNLAFKRELSEVRRKMRGTSNQLNETKSTLSHIKAAIQQYPNADIKWMKEVKALEKLMHDINLSLWGDYHKSNRDVETLPSAGGRLETIVYQCWYSTSDATATQKEQLAISKVEYAQIRKKVDDLIMRIGELEKQMNIAGVPYTPSRQGWKSE
ncbi:MAG: glycosyl hydrolase [Crocinitomix sp.]|nr:glycosyl hydrolase [Crocinitomix sp.]